MCLCGILAAEYQTLPDGMREAVIRFFDDDEAWLAGVLEEGRRQGALVFTEPAQQVARSIVGGLEGAMLVARPYGDLGRFQLAAGRLLAGLTAAQATNAPWPPGAGPPAPTYPPAEAWRLEPSPVA